MAEFAALPLFTDAFMADCGHLSDAERGRYILLLMLMWRAPQCRLPNDDSWLARRFQRTVEDFAIEVKPIIAEFCQNDGNWITQKRLSKEWHWTHSKRRKNIASAKSRWNKEKGECERNAIAACERNAPTPSPSPSEEREKKTRAMRADDWPEDFREQFWREYPNKVGKRVAIKALENARKSGRVTWAILIGGLRKYRQKQDDRAWCNPATWIHGDRWDDQPAGVNGAKQPTLEGII